MLFFLIFHLKWHILALDGTEVIIYSHDQLQYPYDYTMDFDTFSALEPLLSFNFVLVNRFIWVYYPEQIQVYGVFQVSYKGFRVINELRRAYHLEHLFFFAFPLLMFWMIYLQLVANPCDAPENSKRENSNTYAYLLHNLETVLQDICPTYFTKSMNLF